jgi:superfamily I DNA and/or RNA helicase
MIDILKITLPALLVLITAYLLIDKLLKNEKNRRDFELHKENTSTITPIKLRAYERLILVLERTTPHNFVLNTLKPGMNNFELQTELLKKLREEFGHNVSQQIYVSNELWTAIMSAQQSLIKLINACALKCKPNNDASELSEILIKLYAQSEETPTETAIELLKKEIRTLI